MAGDPVNPILISESSFFTTPQQSLSDSTSDYTSVFGMHANDYLKELTFDLPEENNSTPFSYDAMMHNVFSDEHQDNNFYYDEDDEEAASMSNLEFEC